MQNRAAWQCALIFFLCCLLTDQAVAQNPAAPAPEDIKKVFSSLQYLTSREFIAAMAVLLFGILVLLLAFFLARSPKFNADDVVRLTALVLIITGTLFLITGGYSAAEIAPALGVLGTVAGYLLGRSDRKDKEP